MYLSINIFFETIHSRVLAKKRAFYQAAESQCAGTSPIINPCSVNNGGCAHLCVPTRREAFTHFGAGPATVAKVGDFNFLVNPKFASI